MNQALNQPGKGWLRV